MPLGKVESKEKNFFLSHIFFKFSSNPLSFSMAEEKLCVGAEVVDRRKSSLGGSHEPEGMRSVITANSPGQQLINRQMKGA